MATISNTPRPGYVWDSTDNVWYPIGVGNHNHSEIAKTIVDAKGDLIVGTAADTVDRLAVGTNGYAVVADSTASTGLAYKNLVPSQTSNSGKYLTTDGTNTSWGTISAGGMTSIATGTLSGATVSISSIPSTYKHLQLVIKNATSSTGALEDNYLTINNDTSSTYRQIWNSYGNTTFSFMGSTSGIYLMGTPTTQNQHSLLVNFFDYTSTTSPKQIQHWYARNNENQFGFGAWAGSLTTAISSIQFKITSGNFNSGTYTLYGVS